MATILSEDFESGSLAAYSQTGSPAIDGTAAIFGSLGLHIASSAAAEHIQKSLPASTRLLVARFYFRASAAPSATNGMFVALGSSGMRINIRSDGKIGAQAAAGTAINTTGTYMDGLKHYVDVRFDRSGATATVDWKVDGVAQTQATAVIAAADMTDIRIGYDGVGTTDHHIDQVLITDQTGDFPIGAYVPPSNKINPMGAMGFFGK